MKKTHRKRNQPKTLITCADHGKHSAASSCSPTQIRRSVYSPTYPAPNCFICKHLMILNMPSRHDTLSRVQHSRCKQTARWFGSLSVEQLCKLSMCYSDYLHCLRALIVICRGAGLLQAALKRSRRAEPPLSQALPAVVLPRGRGLPALKALLSHHPPVLP